jgi:hypothetical protein
MVGVWIGFSMIALILYSGAGIAYCCIEEPIMLDEKEQKKKDKKTFCGQVKSVLKQAWKAIKEDPEIGWGLILSTFARSQSMITMVTF